MTAETSGGGGLTARERVEKALAVVREMQFDPTANHFDKAVLYEQIGRLLAALDGPIAPESTYDDLIEAGWKPVTQTPTNPIDSIVELHRAVEYDYWDGQDRVGLACFSCGAYEEYPVDFPCPTLRAARVAAAAEQARAEVVARVEAVIESWPHGDNGQDYRRAVNQCRDAVRAALAGPNPRGGQDGGGE